ncbi:VPS13p like involved in vacuolar sorting [Cryptosporidium sp. chipmunk genotype I]|uniref:VPS13p like involved in vacuolar sorting n=1 Tax=Cryptosporidium sp. chipmunk genotype I TaxID=1280935 RepID=UPI00351A004D|nr:VPS13p like involved in vacuolar sorting [Cryptosporidium sp. chipmunk genotype I]
MRRAVSRVAGFVSKWATTFIGKYLENVSEDSFELGLNSGKLQLRNVKIKEGFLEQLRLPIRVKYGCIETINISIPYSNILRPGSSSPLVVEIDDVNLYAGFIDYSEFDSEKIENLVISERLRLIEHWNIQFMAELAEDEYFSIKGSSSKGGSKPFLSRIVSVLIQDVRLKFRRIHIKLGDSVNKELNCGLVLDSLEVRSIPNLSQVLVSQDLVSSKSVVSGTNEDIGSSSSSNNSSGGREVNGELGPDQIHGYEEHLELVKEIFFSRSDSSDEKLFEPFFQKKDSSNFSYRILDLDGLSMYAAREATDEETKLKEAPKELDQVIHPFCCKLLLRQRKDLFSASKMPIYTIYGVLEEIYVTVSEQIIAYCGRILNQIQAFNKQIDLGKVMLERRFLYRPNVPVIGNAKLWWRYAIGCIVRDRRADISAISGSHRFSRSSCNSSVYIRLQEDFTEAKISMYCKDYTLEFHKYFEERMNFDSIGPYFDGGLFNDLLLDFSRQFSEYYILRVPFSRFVSLHTSLVHQWVGKRLEIHSFRRMNQSDSQAPGGGGSGSWIQWLFKFHKISSVPFCSADDVFFDAQESENDQNLQEEDDNFNASVELDETFLTQQTMENLQFFDCLSDQSLEDEGENISEDKQNLGLFDRSQSGNPLYTESSPIVRQFGSISSETPFMAFRVLLRETKLEVVLKDELCVEIGEGKVESQEGLRAVKRSALMGSLRNFGLEFIQSDSRISLLSVLQEFTLDYSGPDVERCHIIYEDDTLIQDEKMWFTFYYLNKKSSICNVQGSSRRRSSLSMSSDFSVDRSISKRLETSFPESSKTTIKINVEKCYVIFYSSVVSALVNVINKYNKSISKGKGEGTKHKSKNRMDNHIACTESGSTDISEKKHLNTQEDGFLQNSGLMDVDIQIETPILVFCHRGDPRLEGVIYNVISFGKISISNNDSEIMRGYELEESSLDLSSPQNRFENSSFDFQSFINKGVGGVQVSPYYRYVLSEKSTYWFKCIQSLCYFARIEEIYLSIYSDFQSGAAEIEQDDQKIRDRIQDTSNIHRRESDKSEKRSPKLPKGVDVVNSYRLFSIDYIDIKLNLLSYKKYNMLDETWMKYIKLFGVLTQLDPFSQDLFEERSFMNLVLSTNSVCLDSKSIGGGSIGDIQLGDILKNIYSSIQINSITSNFDPQVYQSIYLNMIKWIHDSCLSEYFNLGRKLTREKEFKMFKLGLNVQLFWFLRLNSLRFDFVSDDNSWMNVGARDILVLNFIHDHYRLVNFSISQLSMDYLSRVKEEGARYSLDSKDEPQECKKIKQIPLFSLNNTFNFVRFPTSQYHFIEEELSLEKTRNEKVKRLNRLKSGYSQSDQVQVKAEIGSIMIYLRPLILQELLYLFKKTTSPYISTGLETKSKKDQDLGSEMGVKASEKWTKYSVNAKVCNFELVAFQKDTEFFKLVFENTVSVCDHETRREIIIKVIRMRAYNIIVGKKDLCFFRMDGPLDSAIMEMKMISHQRAQDIEDLIHGRLSKMISSSEMLVEAENITLVLFLDAFLHNIYYFSYLIDNIQSFICYLEDNERNSGSLKPFQPCHFSPLEGEAGREQTYIGGNSEVSVPLRSMNFRNSKLIIPSGSVDDADPDKVSSVEMFIELFNFNNKSLIRQISEPSMIYLYIFRMINVRMEQVWGLFLESESGEISRSAIPFGAIPDLNFHLRRYTSRDGMNTSFDMNCFVESKQREAELHLYPGTLSLLIKVFSGNLLRYDPFVKQLNSLASGTISDPEFMIFLKEKKQQNHQLIDPRKKKYLPQLIQHRFIGRRAVSRFQESIKREGGSSCVPVGRFDDKEIQPSNSICVSFPLIKLNLIKDQDWINSSTASDGNALQMEGKGIEESSAQVVSIVRMKGTNLFMSKFPQNQSLVLNLLLGSLVFTDEHKSSFLVSIPDSFQYSNFNLDFGTGSCIQDHVHDQSQDQDHSQEKRERGSSECLDTNLEDHHYFTVYTKEAYFENYLGSYFNALKSIVEKDQNLKENQNPVWDQDLDQPIEVQYYSFSEDSGETRDNVTTSTSYSSWRIRLESPVIKTDCDVRSLARIYDWYSDYSRVFLSKSGKKIKEEKENSRFVVDLVEMNLCFKRLNCILTSNTGLRTRANMIGTYDLAYLSRTEERQGGGGSKGLGGKGGGGGKENEPEQLCESNLNVSISSSRLGYQILDFGSFLIWDGLECQIIHNTVAKGMEVGFRTNRSLKLIFQPVTLQVQYPHVLELYDLLISTQKSLSKHCQVSRSSDLYRSLTSRISGSFVGNQEFLWEGVPSVQEELNVNVIIQTSRLILLNSIEDFSGIPLFMVSVQSNNLIASSKSYAFDHPISITNSGDFSLWIMNPRHGYFEPVIEGCNFNLAFDNLVQNDGFSPRNKSSYSSKVTKRLNFQLPSALSLNISPWTIRTILRHYRAWNNKGCLLSSSVKPFRPILVFNQSGYDIQLIGYPNFESFQKSKNNSLFGSGSTCNIIKNGTEIVLDQINYCFQPNNIQIFQIHVGRVIREEYSKDGDILNFEKLFSTEKVINLDNTGRFAIFIRNLTEAKEDGQNESLHNKINSKNISKSLLFESPYLFYQVEHKNIKEQLGVEKILRILSPLELSNEISMDLQIFFTDGLFSTRVLSNSKIPIPFNLETNNHLCYNKVSKDFKEEDKSRNPVKYNEYYKLKINDFLKDIIKENENLNKYRITEKREKRQVYLVQKGECAGVGFYITIEGIMSIFGQGRYQFYKYILKFKPFLTLISTLPLDLEYRFYTFNGKERMDLYGNTSQIDHQDVLSNTGILEYLRPKALYLPCSVFDENPQVNLEIGVRSRKESMIDNIHFENNSKNFTVLWSCLIDLRNDIKLGTWKTQNTLAELSGDYNQSYLQKLGEIIPGKNEVSMFSVYNLEKNPKGGYPLTWVVHSKYWFNSVGSELSPSNIVLSDFAPPPDTVGNLIMTSKNWIKSDQNLFSQYGDLIKHFIIPLVKREGSIHIEGAFDKFKSRKLVFMALINGKQHRLDFTTPHLKTEKGKIYSLNIFQDRLGPVEYNFFYRDISMELQLNGSVARVLIGHLLLFPQKIVVNNSKITIEMQSHSNFLLNPNTSIPLIPYFPDTVKLNYKNLSDIGKSGPVPCRNESDESKRSRIISIKSGTLRYSNFVLNKNKSWKILLRPSEDTLYIQTEGGDDFQSLEESFNGLYYLQIRSIFDEKLGFEMVLMTTKKTINQEFYTHNISSIFIFNCSNRDLYISQRSDDIKNSTSLPESSIIKQMFHSKSISEFIWEDYFRSRDLFIHNDFNMKMTNFANTTGGGNLNKKTKYISIGNYSDKRRQEKNHLFEVYDFGSNEKKDWIIYKVSKISSKGNNFILGLFSYEDFMNWHSNKGLTRRALSLLQPSRPTSISSPGFRSGNNYGSPVSVVSSSLTRFSSFNRGYSSSEQYIIDIFCSQVLISVIWENPSRNTPQELFLVVLDNLLCRYYFLTHLNASQDFQISIGNIQIDLQYKDTLYPVLFQRLPSSSSRTLNTLEEKFLASNKTDFASFSFSTNQNNFMDSSKQHQYSNSSLLCNSERSVLPMLVIASNFCWDCVKRPKGKEFENNEVDVEEDIGELEGNSIRRSSRILRSQNLSENFFSEISEYLKSLNIPNIRLPSELISQGFLKSQENSNGDSLQLINVNKLLIRLLGINICFDTHFIYILTMFIDQIKEISKSFANSNISSTKEKLRAKTSVCVYDKNTNLGWEDRSLRWNDLNLTEGVDGLAKYNDNEIISNKINFGYGIEEEEEEEEGEEEEEKEEGDDEYQFIDKKDIIKQFPLKQSFLDRVYIKNFKIYPMVIHLSFNLNLLKSSINSDSSSLSSSSSSSSSSSLQNPESNYEVSNINGNDSRQRNGSIIRNLNLGKVLEQFAHTFGLVFSSLIRSITTIEDAPLWMNQFESRESESCSNLIQKIRKHYEHELYSQLYVIATSLGSVGNPVNSFTNIGAGIGDLFYEPIYAVTSGRNDNNNGANVVTGVKKGIESFMNHSVFGTFQAISKMAGTASQIAGALTMDEKYMEERRRFVHGQQPKDLMDGISIGAHAFGKSVTDGLSSLVGEVLDGATTGNPNSLAIGITKGLVAAVVKPITGVLDFTQKTAQGIQKASTVDRVGNTNRTRLPRVFYSKSHVLAPFSREHAFLHDIVTCIGGPDHIVNQRISSARDDVGNSIQLGQLFNGVLYMTICGDGSKIAVVTNDTLLVLQMNNGILSSESESENISVEHSIQLHNIQYVVMGNLFKCNSKKINVCRSVFNNNQDFKSEILNQNSIKGHGYALNIDDIYPMPCNRKEEAGLKGTLFNDKMMSEIVIQMQRQSECISPSPRARNSQKLRLSTPTSSSSSSKREFPDYFQVKEAETPSMVIITHPSTPLPHYRWIECSNRSNLEKLKNVICSLI